jgi:hypothetical protein
VESRVIGSLLAPYGIVRLASNNFEDAAVIDGNYVATDHDFAAIVRAIEVARELGKVNMPLTICARANSFQGPRRAPRRSKNLPDLPRRVLGTQLVRAKWAWTSSLLSTQSFACTAFWVYAWRTPP